MNKVEGQPLPTWHGHVPTSQTANRKRRFWLIAALTGILIFATNFRSALRTASWKPHIVCRKGRLDATPRSHYALPSGDKIPSVALGEPALLPHSAYQPCQPAFAYPRDRCPASRWGGSWPGGKGCLGCRVSPHRWCLDLRRTYRDVSVRDSRNEMYAHRTRRRLETRSRRAGFLGRTSSSPRRHVISQMLISLMNNPRAGSCGIHSTPQRMLRRAWINLCPASRHRTWISTSSTGACCGPPL